MPADQSLDEPIPVARLAMLAARLFSALGISWADAHEQTSTLYDESVGYPYTRVITERRWLDADGRGLVVTRDEGSHPRQGDGWINVSASIVGLADGAKLTLASTGWPEAVDRYSIEADGDAAARIDAAWRAVLRGA